ncbi:hypothetical protein [Demequina sp. NBRC 110055]|uniref:hypothetical protein n=1 Tax=Demequina sp. NBRC 110055 TaxID=1570344 RepID=UPI0013563965|nr:hypothetical protein [Demequina sp. NBRC 110055]
MSASPAFAGPRGRRFLLAVATRMSDAVRTMVFHVGYDLDPGAGTSTVMFGWTDAKGQTVAPPDMPHYQVADVAREISDLDLMAMTTADVWESLVEAVDEAAYWQPPRGEDILASRPELDGPLARVGAAVIGHGLLPRPDGAAYAVIHVRDGEANARWPTASAGHDLLEGWITGTREDERGAERDWPRDPRASYSGAWWSTPPHGLVVSTPSSTGIGPWGLSLVEDAFGETEAMTAPVLAKPEARVRVIETRDDWVALCRAAPLEVTASKRHDWFHTTGRDDVRWVVPDWSAIAADWDAVHLTLAAYLDLAGRPLDVFEGVASVIAGWNPGSTYWFRGASVDHAAYANWVRADQGAPWQPADIG